MSITRLQEGALRVGGEVQVLRRESYEALVEADKVLAAARKRVERLKEQAKEEIAAARAQGYEEGLAEARREEALRHMQFTRQAVGWVQELEEKLVGVVRESVEKVVGTMEKEDLMVQVVRKALKRYGTLPEVRLRVAAKHVEGVRERLEKMGAGGLSVEGDGSLQGEACVLESALGVVEMGPEHQLEVLAAAWQEAGGS